MFNGGSVWNCCLKLYKDLEVLKIECFKLKLNVWKFFLVM